MKQPRVTHVLRAPLLGGSELETAEICRTVRDFDHDVIYPARFDGLPGRADGRFPSASKPRAVVDLEAELEARPGLLHVQFPFLLVEAPAWHDSVLELTRLPRERTVFTVHAAVNVPMIDGLHYVFHTAELAARLGGELDPARVSICPSLVAQPARKPPARPGDGPLRLLWVSRNEEGKFNDDLPAACAALLASHPSIELRFVGRSSRLRLPEGPRLVVVDCPVADLAREYEQADLFWYFPHAQLEETWCRTVTEAMAHGLPIVTVDWGAMASQVLPGAGLVRHAAGELVEAVLELAADPRLRARLGETGRQRAAALRDQALAFWPRLYRELGAS